MNEKVDLVERREHFAEAVAVAASVAEATSRHSIRVPTSYFRMRETAAYYYYYSNPRFAPGFS